MNLWFACLKSGKKKEEEETSELPPLLSSSHSSSSSIHNPLLVELRTQLEREQEETAKLRNQLTEILLASVEEKHKQKVLEERYEIEKNDKAKLQSNIDELHNDLAIVRTKEAMFTSEIYQLSSKLQKHEELNLKWEQERSMLKLQLGMERDLLKPWMQDVEKANVIQEETNRSLEWMKRQWEISLQEIEYRKKIQEEMRSELSSVAGCACGGIQLRSRYSTMDIALSRAEEWNADLKDTLQTAMKRTNTSVVLSTSDMEELMTELQQQCTHQLSVFRKELQEIYAEKSLYDESITDLQLKLQQQCNAIDERDRKRKAWMHAVDTSLSLLARDQRIQECLRRPLVMKAMQFWVGESQMRTMKTSENEMNLIQADEDVQAVYPALTALDELCSKAAIRFPIDHVLAGKTELCKEALTYAYGPDFVAKYADQRSNFVQPSEQETLVRRRLNFSWNGEEFVDDDNACLESKSGSRPGLGRVGAYVEKQSKGGLDAAMPGKVSIQSSESHTPTGLLTGVQRDDQVLALLQQHIQELTDCAAESEATYSQTIIELIAAKDTAEQRAREMEERVKTVSQQNGQVPAFLRAEIERLKSTNLELEESTRSLKKELQELSSNQNDSLQHQPQTTSVEADVQATERVINDLEKKVERSQARIDELLNQSMTSHREIVMLQQTNSMLQEALLSSQSSLPIATAVTVSQLSSSSSPQQGPPPPPVTSPPPLIAVAAREVSRLTQPSFIEPPLAPPMPWAAVKGTTSTVSTAPPPPSPPSPAITWLNQRLQYLANNPQFQQHLRSPLTQMALDCWAGKEVPNLTPEIEEVIKADPSVEIVYEIINELQGKCGTVDVTDLIERIRTGATEISVGTENKDTSKEAHVTGDHKSKADKDNKTKGDSFYKSRVVTVLPVGGVVPRPRTPSFSQTTSRGSRANSSGEITPTKGSTPVRHPSSATPSAPHASTPISPSSQWSPERTGHHPTLHPTQPSNLFQSAAAHTRLIPPPPPYPPTMNH